ncbi:MULTISPECIES: TonB-dependent receptor [unclassified Pedobacter]|uniref:SusC/RagA family TonB-linked outer membrane protein n=1 Tax=unclassified Pedobacter TaxID=2628915 RepID=UPI001D6EB87B|nr:MULTISPECIES: TonB-dependent receptor [unclassified Pedobacter]CAH0252170.1 TonB-dependent receptor SusC [Pedobacter sp. Bi36]CAH0276889.1 TonB-dependent receptor SusC [Pedobacter sp. Bi126]
MKQNLSCIKRSFLLLCLGMLFALGAMAQSKITGKVIASDDKLPVVGATIKIKNGSGGTATDANGAFSLSVKPTDVLVISFVGYGNKEVTVGTQTNISIVLQANNNNLTEVVVTGYSSQRKKDLTGSVAVVSMELLKAQPAASAVEALQGKATGVQIVNDGAPGSTPQIRIRGFSTINNNDPLYVIDGVPFEGKLSWLNQNDIESMQVLKDASSASIYGSRANNGVVIITTKKGSAGLPKITLDSYYGTQSPRKNSFPQMMNPQQYAQYVFNGYTNAGKPIAAGDNYGSGTVPVLPEYLVAGLKLGQNVTAADADPSKYNYSRDPNLFYQITKANKQGTNWFDEITESAPVQNYNISALGGSDNATYSISAGYLNQKGTIKYTGFKRYSFRSNTAVSAFNKRVRFGENAQYSYSEGVGFGVNPNTPGGYQDQGSALGWAYRIPTIIPVYDIAGNFAGSRGSQLGNAENPLAFLFRAKDNVNKNNFFFGNIFGEGDIIPGLVLKTNFGIRYENYNSLSMRYPNLEFSEGNNSNNLSEIQGYNTEWTWTNTLNYNKKFAEKHSLNALIGTEAIRSRTRQLTAGRNDFFLLGNPDYYYLNTGSSNISNASTGAIGSLFSVFAKLDYSFNDRYLASFTIRRDGSSNFGSANKYGNFPAASAAWRLSEEEFMKSLNWVSDLKLRVGYGQTGNQRIPGYQYINRFQSSIVNSAYALGGGNGLTTGVRQNAYQNPDIKWEAVNSLNIGLDFTLLGGAVDGSVDWYNKKTTDMLYPVPLPASIVGMGSSPFVNIGDMSNKGVEFNVAYHYGRSADSPFKFDIGANFSKNNNKIVRLAPGILNQVYGNYRSLQTSVLQEGAPLGSFFGYKTAGIYQSTTDIQNNPSYSGARVGGLRYQDINGDGIIDPKDRTIIGSPHPDFTYGINLNASYKNFDISAFLYGVKGNDIFEATRYFTDFPSFDGAKSVRLLDAWSPTNTSSLIPSAYAGASDLEFASSSYYIQNGSFLRLKNLQIGYSIPTAKAFGPNSGINKIRVYVSATNVFTITKYTGLDPEISQIVDGFSAPGVDQGVYPSPRQFLIGINVGF